MQVKCKRSFWMLDCLDYVNANKNFATEFWVTSIREHLLIGAEL